MSQKSGGEFGCAGGSGQRCSSASRRCCCRPSLPGPSPPGRTRESEGALGWVGELPDAEPASVPTVKADWDIETFRILNSATGEVETIPVRDYVRGAVAAELPVSFHPEAMKAQAVASHTWALYNARLHTGKHPTRSWMERTLPPIRTTLKAMPGRRISSPAMGRTPLPPGRRSPPPQTTCWTRCSPTRGSRSWRCTTPAAPAPPRRRRMSGRPRCPIWYRWIPPPTGTPRLPRARRSSPRRRCAPPSPPPLTGSSSGRTRRCGSPPISYTDSGYVLDIKVGNQTVTGKEVRAALDLRSACFSVEIRPGERGLHRPHGGVRPRGRAEPVRRRSDGRGRLHLRRDPLPLLHRGGACVAVLSDRRAFGPAFFFCPGTKKAPAAGSGAEALCPYPIFQMPRIQK